MNNFYKNRKGFSYAEIMTVVAIMMILSTITIANIRNTGNSSELFVSVQKVISDIRFVQNMSLSATEFEGESPAGGWGLVFDKDKDFFYIYADKANVVAGIDVIDHVCLNDCDDTSEEFYKKIDLPAGTTIDRIYKVRRADNAVIDTQKMTITFEPPDPATHFCETDIDCDYDKVGIILINDNLDKREIIINFFGLVDTNEVYY
ncbi:MAG: hypothetical protein Q7T50_06920 [Candidatus Magasanikbacteria bacterium]|nr:hypothetical protein [Candidatus Magasanikbacteria bacterium]